MNKGTKKAIIGSGGGVVLSVISAAVYDFIKGNDLFSTLSRTAAGFFGTLAKNVSKSIHFPLWLLVVMLLAAIVLLVLVIGALLKKNTRRRRSGRRK
jgi:uncharacterized membrane protein